MRRELQKLTNAFADRRASRFAGYQIRYMQPVQSRRESLHLRCFPQASDPSKVMKGNRDMISLARSHCVFQAPNPEGSEAPRIVILSGAQRSRRIPWKCSWVFAAGFDWLTSHSLSLRPSRPCRGFPSRSILDFARNDDEFARRLI